MAIADRWMLDSLAPASGRRNLVILRAGNSSLHKEWIASPHRDFDLYISYYGADEGRYAEDAEYHEMRKGPKWPCIHDLLATKPELIEQYDAFWFPDDDISANTDTLNRMFAFFHALQLELAQPALTHDSYFSWSHLLQRDDFLVRYVAFVEVMVPIFSRAALSRCLPTFNENRSGWGLDWVWPSLCSDGDPRNVGLIDATPVKHTRPVGGELYKNNPEMDPRREAERVHAKYNVKPVKALAIYPLNGGVGFTQPPWLERIRLAIKVANGHRKFRRNQARRTNSTDST